MQRLKTLLWIQAQLKICDIFSLPAVISKKGDPDSGSVIIRLNRSYYECHLYRQIVGVDGNLKWILSGGEGKINSKLANEYLNREIDRDLDLWVLEIDDFKYKYDLK